MRAKYSTAEERRAAKAAWCRAWRAAMQGAIETRSERATRVQIARACATPFRDAYAHVRGGSFKHEAGEADAVARSVTDSMTGDVHHYRGTGFYAGRR